MPIAFTNGMRIRGGSGAEGNAMQGHRITRVWISVLFAFTLLILPASPVHAATDDQNTAAPTPGVTLNTKQGASPSMVELADADLSEVYAEGFSSFTLENDIVKASLNIEARTFTEIQSLKMGYYHDGSTLNWDEDWTNVSLGSATEDLVCKGLSIEVKFTNLSDPATRTLDYIRVGTPSMTGPITATFNSFSGHIENLTDGVLVDGHRITTLGTRTITSTNSEFYLQLALNPPAGQPLGWYFYWSNATISPAP